jgi:hypothetical protein
MDTNHASKTFMLLASKTSRQPGERNPTPAEDPSGIIDQTETAPYNEITDPVDMMEQTQYGKK